MLIRPLLPFKNSIISSLPKFCTTRSLFPSPSTSPTLKSAVYFGNVSVNKITTKAEEDTTQTEENRQQYIKENDLKYRKELQSNGNINTILKGTHRSF